ncbi:uncharacterized protein DEA37_0010607 [Paragonimus westermani]|uniref:Uncharacterized protein n=1 Tax=Paragonimus westermani TaxID=34504 RepID=A0A5J4P1T2_9TREM|nr:uncharacterized protein DEA37_0010607 [Paragonimus westermani]
MEGVTSTEIGDRQTLSGRVYFNVLAIVRPQLAYCVQAWSLYLTEDIAALGKLQELPTRSVLCLKDLSYQDRLRSLNLFSLDRWRLRGDLIEEYKTTQHTETSPTAEISDVTDDLLERRCLQASARRIALRNNMSTAAISVMHMELRHLYPHLPEDARTLPGYPGASESRKISGGHYDYFGLKNILDMVLRNRRQCDAVKLQIHVDGVGLFKSSRAQL